MKSIFVTYDLVGTSETSSDYENLITRIKEYPNWAKVAKSAWVVKTDDTATQVRDALGDHMDGNDRLFVAVLTGVAAWRNVICKNDWLKENL